MGAPSYSVKKQSTLILLPLSAVWAAGIWVIRQSGASLAADAAVTAWYFFLAFIFLELHFMRKDCHSGVSLSALSLLWGIRAGMDGSRPLAALFPFFDRVNISHGGHVTAVFTVALLLPFYLSSKKERPNCSQLFLTFEIVLTAAACIWETARFTLSLFLLANALHSVSKEMAKDREEKLIALSESETLSELNRMKNQSYADLSHEMKTPLTIISVNAQLAARNLEAGMLDEETVEDIRIIYGEASRLTQMVTSLAGFGQLEENATGRAQLSPDVLARTTARAFQPLAARHGNALTVTAGPDLPPVIGNADRLTQVLINLINNANRHTKNGNVSISIKALADRIQVSVADDGEGIDPELLPHVFERFCRGDKGSTGLGLFICKKIIDEHGGEIGIESEAGKGTRIWFTLPTGNDGDY